MTSSARFQRDADAARVGLADTLGQLRDGMAPSALTGEAMALAKDTGLGLVKSLADQARANPVPALLIGAGLTMLLTRTTGGDVMQAAGSALKGAADVGAEAARSAASAAGSAVKQAAASTAATASGAAASAAAKASAAGQAAADAILDTAESAAVATGLGANPLRKSVAEGYDAAKGKLEDAVDSGRRALHDGEDRLGAMAREATDRARTTAQETGQSVAKLLEEQPILMAALGAALGAAVGAALPISRQEKDMLGGLGATALGAGRSAAATAADVLREEVSGADIAGKVAQVADKVLAGVTEGAGRKGSSDQ